MTASDNPTPRAQPQVLRVLLSEGTSTSAREAITALGLAGHHVEITDPSRHCLGRFSRFVRQVHRCPPLSADPAGYRDFVLRLLAERRFDVTIPIHEQGLLLAKIAPQLTPLTAIALPPFASYDAVVTRTGFRAVLAALDLPQPPSRVMSGRGELAALDRFPLVLKSEIGTASRTVWMVHDANDLRRAERELEEIGAFDQAVLAQDLVDGPVEHAQAVYDRGRLVAMHAFRQLERGAGGGDALKEGVERPDVRSHLARLGERLGWHGALSVDYIRRPADGTPLYIDCNPRLVEPMSAAFAGCDLMGALVRVSLGEAVKPVSAGAAGVRSHLAMQVLLGLGIRGASRRAILWATFQLATGRGPYAGSREELTPVARDLPSVVPLMATGVAVLAAPSNANRLASGGWGTHLLTPGTVEAIRSWPAAG